LHAAFEIVATRDGDDALELVRSRTVDSFSVGFSGIRHSMDGEVVVRTEASLREVSLTAMPAYAGAAVAGVRSQAFSIPRSVAQARLALFDW
jgi:HK97 family phage prohead protease